MRVCPQKPSRGRRKLGLGILSEYVPKRHEVYARGYLYTGLPNDIFRSMGPSSPHVYEIIRYERV